jgi:beta-phosphoglucomutase-like phosphatase (HAD superfamily)
MYKHIIWDFDGTLFDTYPVLAKAVINVLEEQGIYESYDKVMSLMKVSFTHLFNYINDTFYISDTLVSNFKK